MAVSTLYLADESATEKFGEMLARATQSSSAETNGCGGSHVTLGGRIFLTGDLGAGKTTLTRGLIHSYGHEGAVKSPTYTLVEPYELERCKLYHFDLYRLADPEEVEFLGVWEYFDDTNLCIIEWPEKGKGYLPAPDLEIGLLVEGAGRRVSWAAQTTKGLVINQALSALTAQYTDRN